VPEAEIDEKAAEEAVARAQRELAEKSLSGEEHAFVQASLLKSLAQLHVKRRSRH
jgi:F0F1-type ATP synthase epsilon subunit